MQQKGVIPQLIRNKLRVFTGNKIIRRVPAGPIPRNIRKGLHRRLQNGRRNMGFLIDVILFALD